MSPGEALLRGISADALDEDTQSIVAKYGTGYEDYEFIFRVHITASDAE